MAVVIDGLTGITTPGLTNTGTETIVNLTTTGNTVLGDASTDTLNVGNGGLVKDASGNVGIGTSSPGYRLDVASGDATGGQAIRIRANATTGSGGLQFTDSGATGQYGWIKGVSTGLTFSATGSENMRIDSSGNLLVGATSAGISERLNVTQPNNAAGIYVNPTNASFSGTGVYVNTTRAANTAFDLYAGYANSVAVFRVAGNGNIISSGSTHSLVYSNNEFNVAGNNGSADFYLNYRGALSTISTYRFFNGITTGYAACVATSFTPSSDYRIKTDVQDESAALEKVLSLRPVNYIKDNASEREHGLIAHEVAELFPDLVGGEGKDAVDDEGDMVIQTVNYMGLTSILVKAIQEQQAIITQLQADVAALQAPQGTP